MALTTLKPTLIAITKPSCKTKRSFPNIVFQIIVFLLHLKAHYYVFVAGFVEFHNIVIASRVIS